MRSMRLHSPWNVPIHIPRVFTGVSADRRESISFAALLVNVTASTDSGVAWLVASSHAIRVVSTRVLPLPAPARISAEACGSVTAASCSGFRFSRRDEAMENFFCGARARSGPQVARRAARSALIGDGTHGPFYNRGRSFLGDVHAQREAHQ